MFEAFVEKRASERERVGSREKGMEDKFEEKRVSVRVKTISADNNNNSNCLNYRSMASRGGAPE